MVVSSAVESSVGLAAGVALAAALPELRYDCGLATMSLLTGDVTADPLVARGRARCRCGHAIPDPERLAAWESDPAPWVARMLAAARVPRAPGVGAVNPSTAFGTVLADELVRCGLREAVLAPGSRSAPLALALYDRARAGRLRLHVRIDERSAAFLALGLAKASRRPVAVVCTSGTAAAQFHAAVIEADESGVPLIVLTADRPPELRGTGAQPDDRPAEAVRRRRCAGSARPACRRRGRGWPATGGRWPAGPGRAASGSAGRLPRARARQRAAARPAGARAAGGRPVPAADGRPGRSRWTARRPGRSAVDRATSGNRRAAAARATPRRLEWAERGVVVCGDGDYDAGPLLELAEAAGWPVLAEPSSGARRGPNALSAYGYLLDAPGSSAAHRPEVIVSAGRPGLSRGQLAFLRGAPGAVPARHVVVAQGPGRWADPARTATCVAAAVRLAGRRRAPRPIGRRHRRSGWRPGSGPTPPRAARPTRSWTPRRS